MLVLELTEKEANTLKGILLVEKSDLKDCIKDADNANDKKELEGELVRVESMLEKLK